MWDDRYASDEYRFGTQPNRFLIECVERLYPGIQADSHAGRVHVPGKRVLSLGEGEGRNAVYLAGLGFDVTPSTNQGWGWQRRSASPRRAA